MPTFGLPYKRFTLFSPLDPDRVIEKINDSLERNWWRRTFGRTRKNFSGRCDGRSLSLRYRRVSFFYWERYPSKLIGHVEPYGNAGSRIECTVRLPHMMKLVLGLIFGITLVEGYPFRHEPGDPRNRLLLWLFGAIVYLALLLVCNLGERKFQAKLAEVIHAKPEPWKVDLAEIA